MRLTRAPLPPERRAPPPCVGDDWIVSTLIVGLLATGLKVRTRGTQSSISDGKVAPETALSAESACLNAAFASRPSRWEPV